MKRLPTNAINHCNSIGGMQALPDDCIPCTVTSPPYGNMRKYGGHGYTWEDFTALAHQLTRITSVGGVICWVVRNQVHKGGENCQAEKEKLFFVEKCGLLANHTIIGIPHGAPIKNKNNRRYAYNADFIYVFSKGRLRTINLISDVRNIGAGKPFTGRLIRTPDGTERRGSRGIIAQWGLRTNVWHYKVGSCHTAKDGDITGTHPARMAETLAEDLIVSFSKPSDLVFDPMAGAGTTLKMALLNNRRFLGMEIHEEYVQISRRRLSNAEKEHRERTEKFLSRFDLP